MWWQPVSSAFSPACWSDSECFPMKSQNNSQCNKKIENFRERSKSFWPVELVEIVRRRLVDKKLLGRMMLATCCQSGSGGGFCASYTPADDITLAPASQCQCQITFTWPLRFIPHPSPHQGLVRGEHKKFGFLPAGSRRPDDFRFRFPGILSPKLTLSP